MGVIKGVLCRTFDLFSTNHGPSTNDSPPRLSIMPVLHVVNLPESTNMGESGAQTKVVSHSANVGLRDLPFTRTCVYHL